MSSIVFAGIVFAIFNFCKANVLVADENMSRMIEISATSPFCSLYDDRDAIQNMIFDTDPKNVRQIATNLVIDLEQTCKASSRLGLKPFTPLGGLMYPGTKWCGPGNRASSYDDLGRHAAEDACCREHDHCPISLLPYKCIRGICNISPFVRSHCDCDAQFRRCLQNINSEVANTLGALYFNVIQVTCFTEKRPCSEWNKGGFSKVVSGKSCSFKFRPSEKYAPLLHVNEDWEI